MIANCGEMQNSTSVSNPKSTPLQRESRKISTKTFALSKKKIYIYPLPALGMILL